MNDSLQKHLDYLNRVQEHYNSQKSVGGFIPRFFIPGWIGLIQEIIVENKMNKFIKSETFDNKTYTQMCDHLSSVFDNIVDEHIERANQENLSEQEKQEEIQAIALAAIDTFDAYVSRSPEVAYWMNIKIDDQHITCLAGVLQHNFQRKLEEILPSSSSSFNEKKRSNGWKEFGNEMKVGFYQIVGMIFNIIIFAAIFGLLGAIFG